MLLVKINFQMPKSVARLRIFFFNFTMAIFPSYLIGMNKKLDPHLEICYQFSLDLLHYIFFISM